jgi:Ca-activated chloride channel family protein
MKLFFWICSITVLMIGVTIANGVGIVDAKDGLYLKLLSSEVEVTVENQVAIVQVTQVFKNTFTKNYFIKYGFPIAEDASITDLKFYINNQWYQAQFSATEQDTSLPGPGEEVDKNLIQYLGDTPFYFTLRHALKPDSLLTVQLSYVQLLPYENGKVDFRYPNDYRLIQKSYLDKQELIFSLHSERTVTSLDLLNRTPATSENNGTDALLTYTLHESPANFNYEVQYMLDLDELGIFGMSTFLADSVVPDDHGRGFFTIIVEPDPSDNTEVIDKVFTLIIDCSGSMSGEKIVQARNAAKFIINNLNPGDYFNIVQFSSASTSFRSDHTEYNQENKQDALNYINGIVAGGGTNISGAFQKSIEQFSTANATTANIIIFFTDGEATEGITGTEQLVSYIDEQVTKYETDISIFCFGVGDNVNTQLLTRIAVENNGLAAFLENDELEEKITEFYLTIRNPVLLNTEVDFSPKVVSEVTPASYPNLYRGKQLMLSGRYSEALDLTVKLSGEALGKQVTYNYLIQLSDEPVAKNQFLTRVWAKKRIDQLLIGYYSLDETNPDAEAIKQQIIEISLAYKVMSPFTSLRGGDPVEVKEDDVTDGIAEAPVQFELLGNYPNPFNPSTTIRFKVNTFEQGVIYLKIYNTLGQVIKIISIHINGQGIYEVVWDGLLTNGQVAPSGTYFYTLDFGTGILGGKMTLIK